MSFFENLFATRFSAPDDVIETLLLTLLVAFLLGQLNAWCYKWTHRGVSYSRSFTQALILITMISAFTMFIVAMNVIAAFGLLGGLAIIRYRTVVRDARDTAYILLCLVCGMAAGFGYYAIGAVGSMTANLVAFYLHQTGFGGRWQLDSLLRFQVESPVPESALLESVLRRYCRQVSLVAMDEQPSTGGPDMKRFQYAYKVRLRSPELANDLVRELRETSNVNAVHFLIEQEHEEIV